MKIALIIFLSVIFQLIGILSIIFYVRMGGFEWYHLLLSFGSCLITWPATFWWFDKLNEILNDNN